MKPGRNDPCPCGSGRKYKHCCLRKTDIIPDEERHWRRVRRAIDPLPRDLLAEATRRLGDDDLDDAFAEFLLDDEVVLFDPESRHVPLFMSWLLYDWQPYGPDTALSDEPTIAQSYLARAGHRLDPIARHYVEACLTTPFSFHEVVECRPGHGFRLRDVMLGTEADVTERTASHTLQVGDCVFGKIVSVEGLMLIEGIGPTAVAPVHKPILIELRKTIGSWDNLSGVDVLRVFADDLRDTYLDIDEMSHAGPELRNTDDDPLEFHTLNFDLDSPETALGRLEDLGGGLVEPRVERDAAGQLLHADVTWARRGTGVHRDWDTTTLGTLRIEGTRLTAEVNSANRAAALRRLIEERLGDTARIQPGVVQSARSLLARESSAAESAQSDHDSDALAAMPEVQAALRTFMREHYRRWIDEKLPALGNRTPRKAVRDADGREAVAAVLAQIERDGARMDPPLDPEIVRELRATLGLT